MLAATAVEWPMPSSTDLVVTPIGRVHSTLKERSGAPRQGSEGAPDARVEIDRAYLEALDGLNAGDEIILLTWLHQSRREVRKVHPRNNPDVPLTGVFATRAPDRPNPIGLHRTRLIAIEDEWLDVQGLEAIDGTPVVDIKPVLDPRRES
jgi:tRNA-Thr(GGU) m(6)t(6)A37 methyltransferase TsaA